MNFFKSIVTDDAETAKPETPHDSGSKSPPADGGNSNETSSAWSFGGLMKTLAVKSESVIETYSRDLKEFGSGLRKESEILREAASRTVKDLPASLEAGALVANTALDGILKSTAGIVSKESTEVASDGESETPATNRSLNSGRYSWFEAQLSAIRGDLNTFCEEPEDVEEYTKWKLGFELGNKRDEIDSLVGNNGDLEGVYKRIVPNSVDNDTFWCRYFYRVDKLKQQESVRANLVKRTIYVDDDKDLSWDVDDDDDDEEDKEKGDNGVELVSGSNVKAVNVASDANLSPIEKQEAMESNVDVPQETEHEETCEEKRGEKNDEEVKVDEKGNNTSVVCNNPVKEDEVDLEWDEIEDTGSGDEKKTSGNGNVTAKDNLRKPRLWAVEDDEDLNWGTDDEDGGVKA